MFEIIALVIRGIAGIIASISGNRGLPDPSDPENLPRQGPPSR